MGRHSFLPDGGFALSGLRATPYPLWVAIRFCRMALALIRPTRDPISTVGRHSVLPDGGFALSGLRVSPYPLCAAIRFAGWRRCLIRPTGEPVHLLIGVHTCWCVFVGLISVAPSGSYFFSPANAALISSSGSCTPINTSVLCGVSSPHGRSQSAL